MTKTISVRLTFRAEGDCTNVYVDGENGLQFIASAHTGLFETEAQYNAWYQMIGDLYRGYLTAQGVEITSETTRAAEPQGNC